MACHGAHGIDEYWGTVFERLTSITVDEVTLAEQGMNGTHPGKLELEEMVENCQVGCY
jgi:hypothetical protein